MLTKLLIFRNFKNACNKGDKLGEVRVLSNNPGSVCLGVLCVQNGCRWWTQGQWSRLGWPLESREEVLGEARPVHPSWLWTEHWGDRETLSLKCRAFFLNGCDRAITLHCPVLLNNLTRDSSFYSFIFVFLWHKSLQFLLETCKILVIGAGGLGCELLKNLVGKRFDLNNINVHTQL